MTHEQIAVKSAIFCVLIQTFGVLHLAIVSENTLYAIQIHYNLGFLMIGLILIISFPYKTGNHNVVLWKF